MALTSLVTVVIRFLALALLAEACKSVYLISVIYLKAFSDSSLEHRVLILSGLSVVELVIPVVLWSGAGWLARKLVKNSECTVQLGSLSRNDHLQIAFIVLGFAALLQAIPALLGAAFDWLSQQPIDESGLVSQITEGCLGLLLIFGSRLLPRFFPRDTPADQGASGSKG